MVEFGFYTLPGLMFLVTLYLFNRSGASRKLMNGFALGFLGWLAYVTLISNLGLLDAFALPPRVPLLVVIPIIIVILTFTGRPAFRTVIENSPAHLIIYIQSFRIAVELLIFGAFVNEVFPQRVTFEGLNFDILVGISALVVGYLVQQGKMGRTGILIWNIAALAVLSLTVYSFISSFYFTDVLTDANRLAFVRLPYLLLASVLLPFAVFYHVISIRQQLRA